VLNLLENSSRLAGLYGDAPIFAEVDLHEIKLHRDGPTMVVRFDLAIFPDSPPAEWSNYNTVQMVLDLCGVRNVRIANYALTNKYSLEFSESNGSVAVSCFGKTDL
jgi:hypothetical protein